MTKNFELNIDTSNKNLYNQGVLKEAYCIVVEP